MLLKLAGGMGSFHSKGRPHASDLASRRVDGSGYGAKASWEGVRNGISRKIVECKQDSNRRETKWALKGLTVKSHSPASQPRRKRWNVPHRIIYGR